jgi:hypothetical protein
LAAVVSHDDVVVGVPADVVQPVVERGVAPSLSRWLPGAWEDGLSWPARVVALGAQQILELTHRTLFQLRRRAGSAATPGARMFASEWHCQLTAATYRVLCRNHVPRVVYAYNPPCGCQRQYRVDVSLGVEMVRLRSTIVINVLVTWLAAKHCMRVVVVVASPASQPDQALASALDRNFAHVAHLLANLVVSLSQHSAIDNHGFKLLTLLPAAHSDELWVQIPAGLDPSQTVHKLARHLSSVV